MIDSGVIGDAVQITGYGSVDLLSSATHTVDLIRFLLHDAPAEWVIGQIDRRPQERRNAPTGFQQWEGTGRRYGHHIETGAFAMIQFQGGARATVESGIIQRPGRGRWPMTVYGTDGFIEVGPDRLEASQLGGGESWLRARVRGQAGWVYPEVEPNDTFKAEIEALLDVLEHGNESEPHHSAGTGTPTRSGRRGFDSLGGEHPLDGRAARAVHEILMAIFESARRRARIDLPLAVAEHPLEAMIAAGEVQPRYGANHLGRLLQPTRFSPVPGPGGGEAAGADGSTFPAPGVRGGGRPKRRPG